VRLGRACRASGSGGGRTGGRGATGATGAGGGPRSCSNGLFDWLSDWLNTKTMVRLLIHSTMTATVIITFEMWFNMPPRCFGVQIGTSQNPRSRARRCLGLSDHGIPRVSHPIESCEHVVSPPCDETCHGTT